MLCGLHAVNALLHPGNDYRDAEMRSINRRIHQRERDLCVDARDTAPEESGNYPLDALIEALHNRGMLTEHVHPNRRLRPPLPPDLRGFLIATGDHYVSIVRASTCSLWELIDNGVMVHRGATPVDLVPHIGAAAVMVLRVWDRGHIVRPSEDSTGIRSYRRVIHRSPVGFS